MKTITEKEVAIQKALGQQKTHVWIVPITFELSVDSYIAVRGLPDPDTIDITKTLAQLTLKQQKILACSAADELRTMRADSVQAAVKNAIRFIDRKHPSTFLHDAQLDLFNVPRRPIRTFNDHLEADVEYDVEIIVDAVHRTQENNHV